MRPNLRQMHPIKVDALLQLVMLRAIETTRCYGQGSY
jgi:hypothetical protein